MAKFERSKERKKNFRNGPQRRDSEDRRSSSRDSRGSKREFGMTKVTCSACKSECEVPFKPTTNKPIYCNKCFTKKDKTSSNDSSSKDLDIINRKLDKIMRALEI
jgi:CxxC-x17-CxxC domain-containing protein